MGQPEQALVQEYIACWFEQLGGDFSTTPEADADMRRQSLFLPDVASVLGENSAATVSKEEAQDAFFNVVGTTCDGDVIQVTISLEPNLAGLCVHRVTRL